MVKKKKISRKKFTYLTLGGIVAALVLLLIILLVITPTEKELQEGSENCGEGTVIYQNNDFCWQKSTKLERASNWKDANNYCENLTLGEKEDWRLPTLNELSSIIELDLEGVSINKNIFENTEKTNYWTSTKHTISESHWYIDFDRGYTSWSLDLRNNFGVRCIRENSLI